MQQQTAEGDLWTTTIMDPKLFYTCFSVQYENIPKLKSSILK